ncbi:DUF2187 family protein [Thalassobacillus cyri]|nr:DUF2187 family protein [Thalassobacillus cyri]
METPEGHEANIGDIISFKLNGVDAKGKVVTSSCQRCVMVDLSVMENLEDTGFEHTHTVVAPGKYKVLHSSK